MSWDVVLLKTETNADPIDENFSPLPLDRALLLKTLAELAPDARVFPGEVIIDGPGYSVEILGIDSEPLTSQTLFIRGGVAPMGLIGGLCGALGCRAYDTGMGDFIDFSTEKNGFAQWKRYRDHVLGAARGESP